MKLGDIRSQIHRDGGPSIALWLSSVGRTATLRAWLAQRPAGRPELFLNAHGNALTQSGFEYILEK
jgi:hypothetical protein